jgi:hypothetical protein
LIGFDATLDYRTVVYRIVYRGDLGTIFHTDAPPLLMHSNDDYTLNCPIGVHTFTRNLSIPLGSSLEECIDPFLRCGARSGGILDKHVKMITQLRETPRFIVLKGLLVSQSVPAFVENTRTSPTHPTISTSFAKHLEMNGHCSCPKHYHGPDSDHVHGHRRITLSLSLVSRVYTGTRSRSREFSISIGMCRVP